MRTCDLFCLRGVPYNNISLIYTIGADPVHVETGTNYVKVGSCSIVWKCMTNANPVYDMYMYNTILKY